jgi:hypothetical protein
MRHFRPIGILLLIPALLMLAVAAGCGTDEGKKSRGPRVKRPGGGDGGGEARVDLKPVEGKGSGTLAGKAVYEGTPPTPGAIEAMAKHNDAKVCLAGSESEKVEQKWMVSRDGGVANVVVFVQPADKGTYFKLKPEETNLKGKFAEIDQPHCAFVPHVVAYFANYYDSETGDYPPTGMDLRIKNSAPVGHNTRLDAGKLGDYTIASKSYKDVSLEFRTRGPVKLECNMHPWMNGYAWALDTPYLAVTKADGTFEIKNVPTGIPVRVFVWHEVTGFLPAFDGAQGKVMTLEAKTDLKSFKAN